MKKNMENETETVVIRFVGVILGFFWGFIDFAGTSTPLVLNNIEYAVSNDHLTYRCHQFTQT